MKISIPIKEQWVQPNRGELLGDLWATYNIDITSNYGKMRISPQSVVKMSNNSGFTGYDANFGMPEAIVRGKFDGASTDRWWAICGSYMFYRGFGWGGSDWTKDATSGSPTMTAGESDAVEFNGNLIVSQDTALQKLVAGTWGSFQIAATALTTGLPHPLNVSFNNLLLVGNGNVVQACDTTLSGSATRLVFPLKYQVVWIRSSASTVWIGCRNANGGRARVFSWDGFSENFNNSYEIDGSECFSGILNSDSVIHTISEVGKLLAFSGGGFTEVARFPIADNKYYYLNTSVTPAIHRNGMALIDNEIHILIDGNIYSDFRRLENMWGGIWEYTKSGGLIHKYSITKATNTNVRDYGSPILNAVGVLYNVGTQYGKFIAGATLYTDNITTTLKVFNSLDTADTTQKMGHIITPVFTTQEAQENWQKLFFLIKKLTNSTDYIAVRYRLDKTVGLYDVANISTGAWASTTTFTTSLAGLTAGQEIMVLSGEGSGLMCLITTVVNNAGTYTITINQTVTNASGNMSFQTTDWIDTGATINTQSLDNFKIPLAQNNTKIQYKAILYGAGDSPEIEKILSISSTQLKAI